MTASGSEQGDMPIPFLRREICGGMWVGLLLGSTAGRALESGPCPPCAGDPSPYYAAVGGWPIVRVWAGSDLAVGWEPATCTGWRPSASRVVVAAAGRFEFGGEIEDLLARFAEVTDLTTIRYWSITDKRWEHLLSHASALRGPDATLQRENFKVDELIQGSDIYFSQNDNRSTAMSSIACV